MQSALTVEWYSHGDEPLTESEEDALAQFRSGSTEPWTVSFMTHLIQLLKPSILIETGTYLGHTTIALTKALLANAYDRGALLFTVEAIAKHQEVARQNFDRAFVGTEIRTVGVDFQLCEALLFLQHMPERSTDFIFLDDSHDPKHVDAELREAKRILRPGGVCCIHDVIGYYGLDAVVKKHGGAVLEFPRMHATGGLGLLSAYSFAQDDSVFV